MFGFLLTYKYVLLFLGLLVAGETVLLPAIYLVLIGELDFWATSLVACSATFLADAFWFGLGRHLSRERIMQMKIYKKRSQFFDKVSRLFDRHGLRIVVYTKFLYG